MLSEELGEVVRKWRSFGIDQMRDWELKAIDLETALKDAEEKTVHYQEFTDRYRKESLRLTDELAASEKREAVLREAFETASQRVSVGRAKRLMFRCMHCKKDTPLMINGLLDLANKALKEPAEAGDEIQNQDQAARSDTR